MCLNSSQRPFLQSYIKSLQFASVFPRLLPALPHPHIRFILVPQFFFVLVVLVCMFLRVCRCACSCAHAFGGLRLTARIIPNCSSIFFTEAGRVSRTQSLLMRPALLASCRWGSAFPFTGCNYRCGHAPPCSFVSFWASGL